MISDDSGGDNNVQMLFMFQLNKQPLLHTDVVFCSNRNEATSVNVADTEYAVCLVRAVNVHCFMVYVVQSP